MLLYTASVHEMFIMRRDNMLRRAHKNDIFNDVNQFSPVPENPLEPGVVEPGDDVVDGCGDCGGCCSVILAIILHSPAPLLECARTTKI